MPAPPGLGWLGWWDSKPPSSSLSGIPPAKPSVANLPPPSASTGGYAQNGYGQNGAQNTSLASFPAGSGVTPPAASHAPGGYNVGQYSMSNTNHNHSHSHTAQPAASQPGTYGSAAGGLANQTPSYGQGLANQANQQTSQTPSYGQGLANQANQQTSQTPTYGGYQSPYAAGAANSSPRTADGRSSYGAGESAPKLNPYAAQSTTPTSGGSWNDDRAQGGSLGASTNAGADVNAQLPRTYSGSPAAYNSGGSWAAPDSAGAQAAPADRYDASASNSAIPQRRDGAFRPGSTARNGGALPTQLGSSAGPTQNLGSNAAYGSTYPTTAYPSSAYPSTGYPTLGGAERTANGADNSTQPQMR